MHQAFPANGWGQFIMYEMDIKQKWVGFRNEYSAQMAGHVVQTENVCTAYMNNIVLVLLHGIYMYCDTLR